jgi:hypothetical protein
MKIQLFLFYPQGAEVSRKKSKTRKSLDFECSFQKLVRTRRLGGGKKKRAAALRQFPDIPKNPAVSWGKYCVYYLLPDIAETDNKEKEF